MLAPVGLIGAWIPWRWGRSELIRIRGSILVRR